MATTTTKSRAVSSTKANEAAVSDEVMSKLNEIAQEDSNVMDELKEDASSSFLGIIQPTSDPQEAGNWRYAGSSLGTDKVRVVVLSYRKLWAEIQKEPFRTLRYMAPESCEYTTQPNAKGFQDKYTREGNLIRDVRAYAMLLQDEEGEFTKPAVFIPSSMSMRAARIFNRQIASHKPAVPFAKSYELVTEAIPNPNANGKLFVFSFGNPENVSQKTLEACIAMRENHDFPTLRIDGPAEAAE